MVQSSSAKCSFMGNELHACNRMMRAWVGISQRYAFFFIEIRTHYQRRINFIRGCWFIFYRNGFIFSIQFVTTFIFTLGLWNLVKDPLVANTKDTDTGGLPMGAATIHCSIHRKWRSGQTSCSLSLSGTRQCDLSFSVHAFRAMHLSTLLLVNIRYKSDA